MFYRTFGREVASVLFKAAVTITSIIFIFVFFGSYYEEQPVSDGSCNIAVFPIEGVIMPFTSYAEYDLIVTPASVRDFMNSVDSDPNIQGILFEINSPGGTPVAAERIADMIAESTLPTVSLIGDIGASGGYLVAAAADTVIASTMSDVGGIGVTMSYVEESQKNEEEGLTFVPLSSGKFKDAGNPNKPLTEEERALFEGDLALIHAEFIKKVADFRGLAIEQVEALADGASMPGVRALGTGLIDLLGGRETAKERFSDTLGVDVSQINFCEYNPLQLFY
jgi:protease-4